jgi:hypothetical protein
MAIIGTQQNKKKKKKEKEKKGFAAGFSSVQ